MQHSVIDREIIGRYIGQPGQLPPALREQIEREWGNEPVQLYAMSDLDAGLRLVESWVALGPRRLAIARAHNGSWDVRSIDRLDIQAVHESPGLSANTLMLSGAPDEPPLAVARYTQRQRWRVREHPVRARRGDKRSHRHIRRRRPRLLGRRGAPDS
jgi:hypothetical protein